MDSDGARDRIDVHAHYIPQATRAGMRGIRDQERA